MRFEFATASRIVFGPGTVSEVAPAAKALGRRALLAGGGPRNALAALARELEAVVYPVKGEPTVDMVRRGVAAARDGGCDIVVGFGGGSAIDAAKAIAALLANGGDPLDYIEVIGRGRKLDKPSAPCIAVPTTAGTGAEVTRNAVLASPEHRVKASLRSPFMLPSLAVVDPDLTLELPPLVTASTGMDALTQLIEAYVSSRANPLTDGFCRDGIPRAAEALPRAFADGTDPLPRQEMAYASLLGGLALANAGLGAVHGFAAPLGGMFDAPHGAVCAALLPHVMEANIGALPRDGLERYRQVARMVTGKTDARPEDGVARARALCKELSIPPLGAYGVGEQHVRSLVEQAARASSMKANPVALAPAALESILRAAL